MHQPAIRGGYAGMEKRRRDAFLDQQRNNAVKVPGHRILGVLDAVLKDRPADRIGAFEPGDMLMLDAKQLEGEPDRHVLGTGRGMTRSLEDLIHFENICRLVDPAFQHVLSDMANLLLADGADEDQVLMADGQLLGLCQLRHPRDGKDAHQGAVLLGGLDDIIRGDNAARAGHVAHDSPRLAGDIFFHKPQHGASLDVGVATGAVIDQDVERLALIKLGGRCPGGNTHNPGDTCTGNQGLGGNRTFKTHWLILLFRICWLLVRSLMTLIKPTC